MAYTLKRLQPRHQRVMELLLDGERQLDVARKVGMTTRAVRNAMYAPLFQAEYERRRQQRDQMLDEDYVRRINSPRRPPISPPSESGEAVISDKQVKLLTTVRLTPSVFDAMIAYSMVYDIR